VFSSAGFGTESLTGRANGIRQAVGSHSESGSTQVHLSSNRDSVHGLLAPPKLDHRFRISGVAPLKSWQKQVISHPDIGRLNNPPATLVPTNALSGTDIANRAVRLLWVKGCHYGY
jgi:hypothetical protein